MAERGDYSRRLGWGAAAALLCLPLIAMQFTREVTWSGADFALVAALLLMAGGTIELGARISPDPWFRAATAVAAGTALLLVLVNLAVGFLGDEGNRANVIFAAVPLAALAVGAAGRFNAPGMVRAMLAAAAVQTLIGAAALAGWLGAAGIYEIVMGTTLFTALWLLAAGLYQAAASRPEPGQRQWTA